MAAVNQSKLRLRYRSNRRVLRGRAWSVEGEHADQETAKDKKKRNFAEIAKATFGDKARLMVRTLSRAGLCFCPDLAAIGADPRGSEGVR